MEQITGLEYSVQQANNAITSARSELDDDGLLDGARRGNRALGFAGAVVGTYAKTQWGEIAGIWGSNSNAFFSLHDQFGSAVYNFGQGNIEEGLGSVGEFAATGAGTILTNVKSKAVWKQVFKRGTAWFSTPAELGSTIVLEGQRLYVSDQQREWTRENVQFQSQLRDQRSSRLDSARSDYSKHCE